MTDEQPTTPAPPKCCPKCLAAGDRVEVAWSTIAHRWWVVCFAPGCRYFGVAAAA